MMHIAHEDQSINQSTFYLLKISGDTHKRLFNCEQDNKVETSTNSCPGPIQTASTWTQGGFSLHWGGLLVTYTASVLLFALKTELLLLVLTVQAICNVWAVLIFCAKTRNHGRGNVMSR